MPTLASQKKWQLHDTLGHTQYILYRAPTRCEQYMLTLHMLHRLHTIPSAETVHAIYPIHTTQTAHIPCNYIDILPHTAAHNRLSIPHISRYCTPCSMHHSFFIFGESFLPPPPPPRRMPASAAIATMEPRLAQQLIHEPQSIQVIHGSSTYRPDAHGKQ